MGRQKVPPIMSDLNHITVRKEDIHMRHCDSCGTSTAHIGEHDGKTGTTCLQCLVDGGNTAQSFSEWSRWTDPSTGKQLTEPRGYRSQ
jgi:hypothetical protein